MRILGIETSCDETSVAVFESDGKFFSLPASFVSSQVKDHAIYGGVVPEVAARQHIKNIFPLLMQSGISRSGKKIDAIAITVGPGLSPALRIGVEVAKVLAVVWDKPLIAVNHLEGHIYSAYLRGKCPTTEENEKQELRFPWFPTLCLLVSGGHTELILMKDHGVYELIGRTRDDAAGEAFDKVAKMLGLGYPGGPILSKYAGEGDPQAIHFPRPMIDSDDFSFSFSGLKTAVMVYLKENGLRDEKHKMDICASFQEAVVDVLVTKAVKAAVRLRPKSVILTGGVSANTRLRTELAYKLSLEDLDTKAFFAPLEYTGDNAAMIATAGYFRMMAKDFTDPLTLEANPNLRLA